MDQMEKLTDQFDYMLENAWDNNEAWRFIFSLAILVVGFFLLELLWRWVSRKMQTYLEKIGLDPKILDLLGFLPSFRIAFVALFLMVAEGMLILPAQLSLFIHALAAILMAMAIILFLFTIVNLLDSLLLILPTQARDAVSENVLSKAKSSLRITILIAVAMGFLYNQKSLFPEWLWQYAWWRYGLLLIVLVVVYLAARLVIRFIAGMASALKESQNRALLRMVLQASIWPIRLLLITIALYAIGEILQLPSGIARIADLMMGILSTLAVILFIYRLLDVLEYELTKFAQREETPVDQTFVQMVRIFARVVVITVGAIYLIRAVSGKPLSALLAGLGIGGLAIALASQDTLKNFFGSIMIMLDKPFNVGQRVVVDSHDGVVENIGFRSTRVRTLPGHLVTIPNEKIASSNIENIGRRPHIRRLTNITVTYDTPPDKVEKALTIIREILKDHEGMHPEFPPRVYFNEFNDASLNILMIYWYRPPNYWDFVAFSEKVNLQIMRAFETEGIEFAFPTTTTYLAHDDQRPLHLTIDELAPLKDETSE